LPPNSAARKPKWLSIDPVEAEVVRLVFKLFREGDGTSGPMGVKALASWLNAHGYHKHTGAPRGIGALNEILIRTTYKGVHRFNRKLWKTRQAKLKRITSRSPSIRSSIRQPSTPFKPCSVPEPPRPCRRAS
jgi:hypothetical protein